MGKHRVYVVGDKIPHNDFLDYRQYDTYALMVAALAGWGFNETGRVSLVMASGTYYYWNGATNLPWPSAGGAGAPADRSYVTINDEIAVLTGSVQHANIVNQAQLHVNLLHKATHQDGGTDKISVLNLSGKLADEQNAGWIKAKSVDAPAVGDDLKFMQYNHGASKFQLAAVGGGGDMTKAVYDDGHDVGVVAAAADSNTLDGLHGAAFALVTHKDTHKTGGGANAFLVTDLLDGIARVTARANSGANVGSRRRLNFLNGTNTTWTLSDVGGSEEVTVRVDASALTGIIPYETTATALAAYTPSTAGASGQMVLVYSSHATDGGVALFGYANAAWGYKIMLHYGANDYSFCEEW